MLTSCSDTTDVREVTETVKEKHPACLLRVSDARGGSFSPLPGTPGALPPWAAIFPRLSGVFLTKAGPVTWPLAHLLPRALGHGFEGHRLVREASPMGV